MRKIYMIFFILSGIYANAQRTFRAGGDIFGTRVYIENKGQFKQVGTSTDTVKYAILTSCEEIFFTAKGLIHRLTKHESISEDQIERIKRGKKVSLAEDKSYYVYMNWLNCNSNIKIEGEQKQTHYVTYGGAELNSGCFKKIVYKNVYNNIDIEFIIPEDKAYGIKYNVILHPGANPADIKWTYTGDVKKIIKDEGNIVIKTPLHDITEHSPVAYYENNEKVNCNIKLQSNIALFEFPQGADLSRKLVIDPWITNITTLTWNDLGNDVDYDYNGNLYVYGGGPWQTQYRIAKYSQAGTLLWTFSGILPAISWTSNVGSGYASNFLVNKVNEKIYTSKSIEINGARIIRLDNMGNYDNFVTVGNGGWLEMWEFGYDCKSGKVLAFGGGTSGQYGLSGAIVDEINATVVPYNFSGLQGNTQDVVCQTIDNSGNIFINYPACSVAGVNNRLLLINPAFNGNTWMQWSTYNTLLEASNKPYSPGQMGVVNSNGNNCLSVNDYYLYYYDGLNLAAYDKTNGSKVASTTIPGQSTLWQAGIAVDDCNNIYIGGIGNIYCYSFNGLTFTQQTTIPLGNNYASQHVYDIKLYKGSNLLFASGEGFVGTYVPSGGPCSQAQFSLSSVCNGNNNGNGFINVVSSIPNPTLNYIWSNGNNTVSATMSTTALSNSVANLPNGTYNVLVQINGPCGPAFLNTVNIGCCQPFSVTPTTTQVGCTYTTNSVALNLVGTGSLMPTVSWSPAPQSLSVNSLVATGLPVGITTVMSSYGGGCAVITTINILPPPPPLTFSVNNISNSFTISCLTPSVSLQAITNYTYGSVSYSWTSPSFNVSGSLVTLYNPNTLTVIVSDPATGCFSQQVVSVGINTAVPVNNVNPSNQAVTCSSLNTITFSGTATSPSVNLQNDWFGCQSPVPIASSNGTISILSGNPLSPCVYTLVTTNLVNGCKAYKTVTVTSLDAWPSFSVQSATNFSVGCAPLNQTTLSIVNPLSTQSPPATCSYTFLPPGFGGVISPTAILGASTSTITQVPGTWTLIVQDNSNFCRTQIPVSVIQNTITPQVSASVLTQTLTCYNPTILAIGSSSTQNTNISWLLPVSPPNLPSPTVIIGVPPNGPNTSTSSLSYAVYTVVATNSVNACQSSSVLVISQNFKPPLSFPIISVGTPTAIYCTAANNPVVLTTGSSTTTSGGGPLAFPVVDAWIPPSPQSSLSGASSFSAYVAGIYSLTIMDNYNGCKTTGTINVIDKTQIPLIVSPQSTVTLDCGSSKADLITLISGASAGLMYWYSNYPAGAAFSPTSAPIQNMNPFLSGTSSGSVSVSTVGLYNYIVTNTLTGCQASGIYSVVPGSLAADFTPEPSFGYAPLDVNFNPSGLIGANNIWSFGNGTSITTTANINTSATYTAPGTYTVMLISQKGTCMDTAYKVIKVDQPSKLEVPNIFTPNGDGSNDVFFLKVANMGEIHAIIFDRWGNKVYETSSGTGNIVWDGKNLSGKECAAGVYFYIITGDGKDDKHYEQKGNVSIYR